MSGAVSISPAFVASTSHDDKLLAFGLGSLNLILGGTRLAFALATDNQYEHYQKQLESCTFRQLDPRGAAGLWAIGTF